MISTCRDDVTKGRIQKVIVEKYTKSIMGFCRAQSAKVAAQNPSDDREFTIEVLENGTERAHIERRSFGYLPITCPWPPPPLSTSLLIIQHLNRRKIAAHSIR
jgi:hypothetical protein